MANIRLGEIPTVVIGGLAPNTEYIRLGEIPTVVIGGLAPNTEFLCEQNGLPHGVWKCCQCHNLCLPDDEECHFCGHCKCCPCEPH